MVFSFFKKDPKNAPGGSQGGSQRLPAGTSRARPLAKAAAKSPGRPYGESPAAVTSPRPATAASLMSGRDSARSLAKETAAKIDAIESEMARDFLRRPAANTGSPVLGPSTSGRATAPATAMATATPGTAAAAAPVPSTPAAADADEDHLGASTDVFLGSFNAMELTGADAGSVIDETTILFANGQSIEAEETLRHGIDNGDLGAAAPQAWLMLFELVNQRGDKGAFDQLSMQFALHFGEAPPGWVEYDAVAPAVGAPGAVVTAAVPANRQPAAPLGPGIDLPAVVDGTVVRTLEALKRLSVQHSALRVDASQVHRIDAVGAELLLRVVNAFKRSKHQLTLFGCERLVDSLCAAVQAGRRDPSPAGWLLLLELLRLLDRHEQFEETAIQYCITYEVSPPSWEAATPNLKVGVASVQPAAVGPVASPAGPAAPPAATPLDWRGVIDGEGEPHFSRLATAARNGQPLAVDCRYLKRMGFTAASALLSLLMKVQTGGVRVEFRNVNPLVVALLKLLGVTAVVAVQPRRP